MSTYVWVQGFALRLPVRSMGVLRRGRLLLLHLLLIMAVEQQGC